eukprot:CAMPEP_0172502000 /NCGR_PEP_ID=MMETSP1066-20121228/155661_1 /TAXON_ID=671091 /ORGANISM="Coscinodiscus wailesii, Strain CCMP2513" /LENGTH=135 /DNA_ID=CAMNT_0013277097 /DNA_START=143 /DNA_END=547 /DNA_ORIENTATION=+
MPLYLLSIKAELDGVSSLSLDPHANLRLSLRNPLSDYETRDDVVIDPDAAIEPEGREPAHHFALMWEGSKKKSFIEILDGDATKSALKKLGKKAKGTAVKDAVTGENSGDFVAVLALECRGVEPYGFHPMGGEFV